MPVVEDTLFKHRLKQACDDSPIVPEFGKGRQVAIAKRLDVTQEAVRKWFSGEALPKNDKLRDLADYLEVDLAWLALGVKPEMGRDDKRKASRTSSGAIYIVTGMIQIEGGHTAFPNDKDPLLSFVHVYAIFRGSQYAIHVCTGHEMSNGSYELVVPRKFTDAKCVGFIPYSAGRFHLIDMPVELIEEHKHKKGGEFAIHVNKIGNEYHTGSDSWPRFRTFTEVL